MANVIGGANDYKSLKLKAKSADVITQGVFVTINAGEVGLAANGASDVRLALEDSLAGNTNEILTTGGKGLRVLASLKTGQTLLSTDLGVKVGTTTNGEVDRAATLTTNVVIVGGLTNKELIGTNQCVIEIL